MFNKRRSFLESKHHFNGQNLFCRFDDFSVTVFEERTKTKIQRKNSIRFKHFI